MFVKTLTFRFASFLRKPEFLTITTDRGIDVLVHIGIDTVMLKGEGFTPKVRQEESVQAGKSIILSLELIDEDVAPEENVTPTEESGAVFSATVTLPNPAGPHARPAAILTTKAKKFKSVIRLVRSDDTANAKSLVAIMVLSTRQHDQIRVKAWGSDAGEAASVLAGMLADGCGEKPGEETNSMAPANVLPQSAVPVDANEMTGVSASPGLAVHRQCFPS